MNLQQLRSICAVVDCGFNVSEAARRVHLTQSALSKQIGLLEGELRTEVFRRARGRLVALTPIGERVLFSMRAALGSVTEIETICATEGESPPERFLVGASRSVARDFLPDVVARFTAKYRDVEMSIIHDSLPSMTHMLLQGDLSLVLTIENGLDSSHIVSLPMHEVPRVIVVPRRHPLQRRKPVTLEALAAYPLVLHDETVAVRHEVLRIFKEHRLMPRIALNAPNSEVIKAHVAKGIGVGVLARSAVDPERDKDLSVIDASHLFPHATVRILFNSHHYLRKLELEFIALCAPAWTRRKVLRMQEDVAGS